jgi:hypothetical protein
MTSENPVADRLLSDARKKGERAPTNPLGIAALVLGLLALAASGMIPGAGWALGVIAVGVSIAGMLRPASAMLSRFGLAAGLIALAWATYRFLSLTGRV